jgi:hypothetical protein
VKTRTPQQPHTSCPWKSDFKISHGGTRKKSADQNTMKEMEIKTTTHTHTKREEKRERDGDNLHDAVAMTSGAHKLPDPQSRIPAK